MIETTAKAVLIREPQAYWRIELRSLDSCRQAIGPDALNAFCCCFVQLERLTSLAKWSYLSRMHSGPSSLGFARNMQAMACFIVGTLCELAVAIRHLRGVLERRGSLDPESATWRALCELEHRWDGDPFFGAMRNISGLNVAPELIDRGLVAMDDVGPAIVSEGQGSSAQPASIRLGSDALFQGCEIDVADLDRFIKVVTSESGTGTVLQDAFLLTLKRAGVPLEEIDVSLA